MNERRMASQGPGRAGQDMELGEPEIQGRKDFLQFGPADETRLTGMAELARRYAEPVIEAFYEHLMSFEVGQTFFRDRATLERVKQAQKAYFQRLSGGHYDRAYVADRLHIGRVHERIGLPTTSYLGMYSFYLARVAEQLFLSMPPAEAQATFLSFLKLVFFDISLAVDSYLYQRERTIRLQQEAILELSTPVLPLREGLLLLPIVGTLDSNRALQLTEQLLRAVRAHRARVVVLDITAVPQVDSRVANHLVQTVEAARLMGATAIVSGLSPEVAQALVILGVDLSKMRTVGDLQGGIEEADRLLGYVVTRVASP